MRGLLRSIPPTFVLPTCDGAGSCSSIPSAMAARIDATQGIHEWPQNALGLYHDLGELLQRTSIPQFLRIVDHDFDAKHALAFGIDLQSQPATVQLENRRSL